MIISGTSLSGVRIYGTALPVIQGQILFAGNAGGVSSLSYAPSGASTYKYDVQSSWTVPAGVTSICVVCIGAGGSGAQGSSVTNYPNSGGGGGLSYVNNITVTPGETLYVTYGPALTAATTGTGSYGSCATLWRGSPFSGTLLCGAMGGQNAQTGTGAGQQGGWFAHNPSNPSQPTQNGTLSSGVGYYGGSGGSSNSFSKAAGGGGAAGYTGNGGLGGGQYSSTIYVGASVSTGGGGGGGGTTTNGVGGGGGGVAPTGPFNGVGGGTGTNGVDGTGGAKTSNYLGAGLFYGGGGGGITTSAGITPNYFLNGVGGPSCVRIIWGPNRAFPSTNTADV